VVSALAALTNLEQLTWHYVQGSNEQQLSDSSLLQQMTQKTSLNLQYVAAAALLQHLGSLTKLQHLIISAAQGWGAAGCPGLQELKALTSLKLASSCQFIVPASASQLTALRQLEVRRATPTALSSLHVLTNLTQLCVRQVTHTVMCEANDTCDRPHMSHHRCSCHACSSWSLWLCDHAHVHVVPSQLQPYTS